MNRDKDSFHSSKMWLCDQVSIPVDSGGKNISCLPMFADSEARLLLPGHQEGGGRTYQIMKLIFQAKKDI